MTELIVGGFQTFAQLSAVLLAAFGVFMGLLVGVLPGIGPFLGVILLTPVVIYLPPVDGIGLLIGVYVGGSAGGAISAILLNIPGTPIAAATMLDGYPMARQGRASEAVGLALASSALGGLIGGIALVFTSPLLARIALKFGPPEYFSLTVLGLIAIAVVAKQSTLKGLLAACLGLLISAIGTDPFTGFDRFTFGHPNLMGGFELVALLVGLFAISEMFVQIEEGGLNVIPRVLLIRPSFASVTAVLKKWVNLLRSSVIGTIVGAIPGTGGVASSFVSYAMTKASSKDPDSFGRGNPEGVISAEAANNACCGGSLIPALALGIPGEPISAVILGALLILGLLPGPRLFVQHPEFVGGVFYAYLASNVLLLVLGMLSVPLFVSLLKLRKNRLIPLVLLLSIIGTYSVKGSLFDVWSVWAFGAVGYILRKAAFPLAPLVIARVLGPIMEPSFRRSLILTDGSFSIFIERPIALGILVFSLALLVWTSLPPDALSKLGNKVQIGRNKEK
jgi:putative tricarboxylic transport membrane protein